MQMLCEICGGKSDHTKPCKTCEDEVRVDVLVSRIMANADEPTNEHELHSVTDGYDYNITRKDENDTWYIQVCPTEQGFLYDGWWRDSEGEPIKNAIKEAIKGAGILKG